MAGKNGDFVVIAPWYLTMGALVHVGDAKNPIPFAISTAAFVHP